MAVVPLVSTLLPLAPTPEPLWTTDEVRVRVGQPIMLTWQVLGPEEAPVVPDAGTPVTYTVLDGAGVQLATGQAVPVAGQYQAPIAAQASPDTLTVTWGATVGGAAQTDTMPVVIQGRRLVSYARMQADPQLANMAQPQLEWLRTMAERLFDRALGFPCVPQAARVEFWNERPPIVGPAPSFLEAGQMLYGAGAPALMVPTIVRPLSLVAGVINRQDILDPTLVYAARGALYYADARPWVPGHYQLWLVHGFDRPPQDLVQAAVIYARYAAKVSNLPERAASVTSEAATIVFAIPTPDRPTGLPDVDAVLTRYRHGGGTVV